MNIRKGSCNDVGFWCHQSVDESGDRIAFMHHKGDSQGLSNQEITRRIEKALAEEYLKMLYENVYESKDLEAIAFGIGKTLISHSRALEIMKQEVENMEERTLKHIEEYRVEMCRRHQVKSKVAYWLAQCVKNERAKYLQANLYTVHLKVIERCKNEHLEQAAYFIQRELDFLRQVWIIFNNKEMKIMK